MTNIVRYLNTTDYSAKSLTISKRIEQNVVGQSDGISAIVDIMEKFHSKLYNDSRPIGILMFLGPSGVGKTRMAESLCEALFEDEKACLKIDCAEYQNDNDICKLIGSPPGYVGHSSTPPRLSQVAVDKYKTENYPISVVLFDEIEKANAAVWNLLLGILDKGIITLGDNQVTNMSKSIIIMTSNVGSTDLAYAIDGGMGFNTGKLVSEKELTTIGKSAANRKFPPEFLNRVDKIITFHSLNKAQIEQVADIELLRLQKDVFAKTFQTPLFKVSKNAKQALIKEGFDPKQNARNIRRIIENRIQLPLAKIIASEQITRHENIFIDVDHNGEYTFGVMAEAGI